MKSILDPSFQYTKSFDTDLRKTFAKIRRELRQRNTSHGEQPVKAAAGLRNRERVAP